MPIEPATFSQYAKNSRWFAKRSEETKAAKLFLFLASGGASLLAIITLQCYPKAMNAEIIGFIAGILVATALLPQVIKSWKTKSTADISLGWSITSLLGQMMWIVYGAMIGSYSLITMSSITFVMALSVFYLKLKYGMSLR